MRHAIDFPPRLLAAERHIYVTLDAMAITPLMPPRRLRHLMPFLPHRIAAAFTFAVQRVYASFAEADMLLCRDYAASAFDAASAAPCMPPRRHMMHATALRLYFRHFRDTFATDAEFFRRFLLMLMPLMLMMLLLLMRLPLI